MTRLSARLRIWHVWLLWLVAQAVSHEMVEVVGSTLHPSHVSLWLRSVDGAL